jgi:hypothetical protein
MKTRPGAAVYNDPGTSGGTAAKWDPGITSELDLVAVVTVNLSPPVIRAWIKAVDGTEQVWNLISGVPPIPPSPGTYANGFGVPADYNPNDPKFWAKASS